MAAIISNWLHPNENRNFNCIFNLIRSKLKLVLFLHLIEFAWSDFEYLHLFSIAIRLIDHGDGLIALRVFNPMAIDSGFYTCMVASEYGCCSTSCEVTIKEAAEVVRETIAAFIEEPVPVVAMHGSVVSFCARISPVAAKVKWFVCGREITESSRGTIVSQHMLCICSFLLFFF